MSLMLPHVCRLLVLAAALGSTAASVVGQSGSGLGLPGGYDSAIYFNGFTSPVTALARDPLGRITAATLDGEIRTLIDANNDGVAESSIVYYTNGATGTVYSVTSILWIGNTLYVSHLGKVTTMLDTNNDGVADVVTDIITNLPTGYHQNNGLLLDDATHFFICNGSATDLGPETSPLNAAVLRADLSGQNITVWASGLRNTFRLARHPTTGDVFGADNEWNFNPAQPLKGDEVNRVLQNQNYGFPAFFGAPPAGSTTIAPIAMLPPRVAPTGLAFNPGTLFSGYKDELFITLFSNTAHAIVRVPIWYGATSGQPAGIYELFATGFTNPIDCTFLPDGSLVVADFSTSLIHRIFPKHPVCVTFESSPTLGTTAQLKVRAPGHAGEPVFLAASDSPTPAIQFGQNLTMYVSLDSAILYFSITPGNGVFNFPVPGTLNAIGETSASIVIPNYPPLIGLHLWLSAAVLSGATGLPIATSPEQSFLFIPNF